MDDVHVLHLPYIDANPYQDNLTDALEREGVSVTLASGYPLETIWTVANSGLPDVVHLHWICDYLLSDRKLVTLVKPFVFVSLLVGLRLFGVRIAWTVHNLVEEKRRHPAYERFWKRLLVTHLFDRVFVHWPSAKKGLADELELRESEREKIRVIPHGNYVGTYENSVGKEEARAELGLPEDAFLVVYFGRIRPYKQVPLLVESFRQVSDDNVHLVIAGNTDDESTRRRILDGVERDSRIHAFLEVVPDDEIQLFMNAADVTAFPLREMNPKASGSVMLAASFAKPVIVPRVDILVDGVAEDGVIPYDPDDPDGLVDAIEAAPSADTEEMGEANYETAKRYSWDVVGEKTAEVYREVVS